MRVFNLQGVSDSAKFQLDIRASNSSMLKVQGSVCGDYNISSGDTLDTSPIFFVSVLPIDKI